MSKAIVLETVANDDGFKDYDEIYIDVLHHYIELAYPNPASEEITLSYVLNSSMASTAKIEIASQSGLLM